MPHQCVKCGEIYSNTSDAILSGCKKCGGKVFFFIKKDALRQAEEDYDKLSTSDKHQIEKDVYQLIGEEIDIEKPVILDIESIRILKPGKYELDLVSLMRKKAVVYKLEEGKYIIDLVQSLKS